MVVLRLNSLIVRNSLVFDADAERIQCESEVGGPKDCYPTLDTGNMGYFR